MIKASRVRPIPENAMRSTVLFRVLLVVVVVIATRPCLANVKNDFHETNGGNICNYTAQVSRGGLGGGGVGVSEKNSSGMLLGERKFSGGNGGKGGGGDRDGYRGGPRGGPGGDFGGDKGGAPADYRPSFGVISLSLHFLCCCLL